MSKNAVYYSESAEILKKLQNNKLIALSEHWQNPKIVKHIVAGNGRKIVFTKPSINLPKEPSPETKEAAAAFRKNLDRSVEQFKKVNPLPICTYKRTTRYETIPLLVGSKLPAGLKMLFLPVSVPSDAGELFGYDTLVVECEQKKGDACALVSNLMFLTCLPTKFVFNKNSVTVIEGEDALKNDQLDRKDKIHPMVRAKLDYYMGLEN